MNIDVIKRRVIAFESGQLDPNTKLFLNASGITDQNISLSLNRLVVSLKEEDLWEKAKIIYPFVGGTEFTHKWNLKNPQDTDSAFRATFGGNVDHNINGVGGNGSTAFINTHAKTDTHIKPNQHSLFSYIYNNVQSNTADFGCRVSTTNNYPLLMFSRDGSNRLLSRSFITSTVLVTSINNSIGLFGFSRIGNNIIAITNNTLTNIGGGFNDFGNELDLYLLARNTGNTAVDTFTTRGQSFFWFGDGLIQSEIENLNTIIRQFISDLSRPLVT